MINEYAITFLYIILRPPTSSRTLRTSFRKSIRYAALSEILEDEIKRNERRRCAGEKDVPIALGPLIDVSYRISR